MEATRFLGTTGAAALLGLGPDRVRQLAREGALPHIFVDGKRVYRLVDVQALVAERAAKRGRL
jgi:excisionase family DNA binding protein